jgi:AcrR family transcriptional regulator
MTPRSKAVSQEMREQSRTALIEAGRKLFAGKGYFNTRISDIAQEAGMSQGNVYWYFSSKEELLKAVLADGFETLGDLMQSAAEHTGTSQEKLDQLLVGYLDFGRERGDFNAVLVSLIGHGGDEIFKELGFDMTQIGIGYTQSLEKILSQGQRESTVISDIDPKILAMFFFGLFNGLNLTYGQDWLNLPPDVIRDAVYRLLGMNSS